MDREKKSNNKGFVILIISFIALFIVGFMTIPIMDGINWRNEVQNARRRVADMQDSNFQANRMVLTREDFIYDFEQLINELEQHYPFFWIIHEMLEVDMHEVGQKLLNYITNDIEYINWEIFYELLVNEYLAYANHIGNLSIFPNSERIRILNEWFDHEGGDILSEIDTKFAALTHSVSVAMLEPVDIADIIDIESRRGVIEIVDIELGRISYLGLRNILPIVANEHEISTLRHYFWELDEHSHLIIDLRDNQGGSTGFMQRFIGPLVRSNVNMAVDSFFIPTAQNLGFLSEASRASQRFADRFGREFRFGGWDIMMETVDDYPIFHDNSGRKFFRTLRSTIGHPQSNFNGKIWVLINENTMAEAIWVAEFLRHTELATLVGSATTSTAGSLLPRHQLFNLPRSGIIVQYDISFSVVEGSNVPMEFGVKPHYFNREGMDALETVLAMIAEMDLNE